MEFSKGLKDYLDGYTFVDDVEILCAIIDYYKIDCPSWGELAEAGDLVEEYKDYQEGKKVLHL